MRIPGTFLLYGANGYTGELIAREAKARGSSPVLAGRSESVARLAGELSLEHRIAALDDGAALDRALSGVAAVLNCAGPFSRTAKPLVTACLRARAHYLDITGEVAVFEKLAARDGEAAAAKVMLLPGCGFDVVPSDCLAAHLKRRLPGATALTMAFSSTGGPSRGTTLTLLSEAHKGGVVRREGMLLPVPAAWRSRRIDFGHGPRAAITVPWGDVSTAWYSTRIPNIEMYLAANLAVRTATRATRFLGWALATGPVQRALAARVRAGPAGPTPEERARSRTALWGEVTDGAKKAVSRLFGVDGYTTTVRTSLAILERVLAGEAPVGFQTPSKAYGADFILGIEGYRREDVG